MNNNRITPTEGRLSGSLRCKTLSCVKRVLSKRKKEKLPSERGVKKYYSVVEPHVTLLEIYKDKSFKTAYTLFLTQNIKPALHPCISSAVMCAEVLYNDQYAPYSE